MKPPENEITEEMGLYYKRIGDNRWHLCTEEYLLLMKSIPDYIDDVCPHCGNEKDLEGCRCMTNHRTCPVCKTRWHWEVDKLEKNIIVVIDTALQNY